MMLPLVLILVAAVGVAWPFMRQRGLIPAKVLNLIPARANAETVPASGPIVRPQEREALCPQCSRLNMGGATHCMECGGLMPVDKLSSLWSGDEKQALIPELVQCGILLAIMVTAMALSYNLPITGKIVVLLLTIGVLSYRLFKFIQD